MAEHDNNSDSPTDGEVLGGDFFNTGGSVAPTQGGVVPRETSGHLAAGTLIRERYRIVRLLGEGGMGVVYLVNDEMLGQEKAMKLLHPQLDEAWRQKLVEELRLQQQLSHEGILRSYAMDIDPSTGRYFFTMEYVEGPSLEQLLQNASQEGRRPPFTQPQIHEFLAHLTDALGYAHEKQIVHRDLKPSNILMLPSGGIKLLDFGIARQVGEDALHTGLVGTAIYMAPEQMRGGAKISPSADVYSVGVMLYQMMTGELFYGRMPGPSELLETFEVASPFSSALDDVVLKSLEAIPKRRFATMDALCDAFEAASTRGERPASISKSRQSRAKQQFWKEPPQTVQPIETPVQEYRSPEASDAIPFYESSIQPLPTLGAGKAVGFGCLGGVMMALVMMMALQMTFGMVWGERIFSRGHRFAWIGLFLAFGCGLFGPPLMRLWEHASKSWLSWGKREVVLRGMLGAMIGFSAGMGLGDGPGGVAIFAAPVAVWFIRNNTIRKRLTSSAARWVVFGLGMGCFTVIASDGRLFFWPLFSGAMAGLFCGPRVDALIDDIRINEGVVELETL